MRDAILVVNAGSSSLKFQIFSLTASGPLRHVRGQIDGIGTRPRLRATDAAGAVIIARRFVAPRTVNLGNFNRTVRADGPFPITVNWGDGTPDTAFAAAAPGAITPQSHTYTTTGAKAVTITVTDAAGQTHSASFVVTVNSPDATLTPSPSPTGGGPATPTPTLQPNVQFLPAITKP